MAITQLFGHRSWCLSSDDFVKSDSTGVSQCWHISIAGSTLAQHRCSMSNRREGLNVVQSVASDRVASRSQGHE